MTLTEPAHSRQSITAAVIERVQLMHQPRGVNPAQRMTNDVELTGVVAQHHRITQEPVRLYAAPQAPLVAIWIESSVMLNVVNPSLLRWVCHAT